MILYRSTVRFPFTPRSCVLETKSIPLSYISKNGTVFWAVLRTTLPGRSFCAAEFWKVRLFFFAIYIPLCFKWSEPGFAEIFADNPPNYLFQRQPGYG